MRYASLSGRVVLVGPDGRTALDVEQASDGLFTSSPQAIYEAWEDFAKWAASADLDQAGPFDPEQLRAPVPAPRQLFAVGLNYGSHASEVGLNPDGVPPIFTKFVSSITGPYAQVAHPGGSVDWEVELVVVIAREARRVPADHAWSHVAGLTVGQDISERELQHVGTMPQFSLGKSYPGFAPMGPWVVTQDEFPDPDDLELACWVNGELVQRARTSEMIMSVPQLIARLSHIVTLLPGDVIYTGTPAGVGLGRTPPRFLAVGDELTTRITGIGELRTVMVAEQD
jgi:2-keto-4-pentenoate hydratase/2-oxohepta-3-ene-1,7-dioic acid hydratase in catechol pathway